MSRDADPAELQVRLHRVEQTLRALWYLLQAHEARQVRIEAMLQALTGQRPAGPADDGN